jgi:hypothetical protein
VEVHRSARRHGVSDEDMAHALEHALAWVEVGDDPTRYLLGGPNRAGNLLELVVIEPDAGVVLVIHAMPLRAVTRRELFGTEKP